MIDRRAIVTGVGASVLARALPATAQQARRLPVVAIVAGTTLDEISGPEPRNLPMRAFIEGLRDHGWIEGHSIELVRRATEGRQEPAPAIFAELLAGHVDVMFLGGTSWLHSAARRATQSVPLIAMFADDPIAAGFASSLARPGGNMTGITRHSGPEIYGKRLQLLQELAPGVSRTALLAPSEGVSVARMAVLPPGSSFVSVPVDFAGQVEAALATVLRERADSLMVTAGPQFHAHAHRIAAFASEARLPGLYAIREIVEAGGLASYGPDVPAQFRQAAKYVDQILKGVPPAELPIEQPTRFDLVINLKTARALGLTIPPSILIRADEVIE